MSGATEAGHPKRRAVWLALPFLVFLGLAGLFLSQLLSGRDGAVVPSALIGAPAPATNLPPLEASGLPGLNSADFKGQVTLLNVWASWCAPCREENPVLLALAGTTKARLVGLNYKDSAENAAAFLAALGNPFAAIGRDPSGRTAIDWGVYGVPETFLIGKDGRILLKHVGPLDERAVRQTILPAVEAALAAP